MRYPALQRVAYVGAALFVAALWFLAPFELALWGTFAIVCVLFSAPVQLVGSAALTLLCLVALSQLIPALALHSEQLAVYVFYLLCICVLLQLRTLGDEDTIDSWELVVEALTLDLRQSLHRLADTSHTLVVRDEVARKAPARQTRVRHHDIKHPAFN